jgi:predicted ATPase/signal transduction histidine kinase
MSGPAVPATHALIFRAGSESLLLVDADSGVGDEAVFHRSYGDTFSQGRELVRNDFQMTRGLGAWGVLVPEAVHDNGGGPPYLLYAAPAAARFRAVPPGTRLDPVETMIAAETLVQTVGRLHTTGILHLGINPFNILWRRDDSASRGPPVVLMGFGRAARPGNADEPADMRSLPREYWPYLSPEQTGRTRAGPDERSDYYSLGATVYALAAGVPPLLPGTLEESLYAILTRAPAALQRLRPDLPVALSRTVMRLLSKDPADRPSSAREILQCLRGAHDRSPGRPRPVARGSTAPFVGRRHERELMHAVLSRVRQGEAGVVCVSGFSGTGKTTLVLESLRPSAEAGGILLTGKFEQGSRAPYSAFVQAFDSYLVNMLTRPEADVASWKERAARGLQSVAPDLGRVFTGIEVVCGPPIELPRSEDTPVVERKRLFQMAMETLARTWAAEAAPVVLFLDDLQWADAASLELCLALAEAEVPGLLVAVAYRENEIAAEQPLGMLLQAIVRRAGSTGRIVLGPLAPAEQGAFIRQLAPGLSGSSRAALTLDIGARAGGNPLFILQQINRLRERRSLFYDFLAGRWHYDPSTASLIDGSPDIIAFLSTIMQDLPRNERHMLSVVSYPSAGASIRLAARIAGCTEEETDHCLRGLSARHLVVAAAAGEDLIYRPAHDNIRQAARELIPIDRRPAFHVCVGRILRDTLPPGNTDRDLYEVADHLNAGSELIVEPRERCAVAALDLRAGVKSKAAGSFSIAARYLRAGVSLLPPSGWHESYALALSLFLESAEAEFLVGEFDQMDERIDATIRNARTFLDSVRAYEVKIQALMATNKLRDASRLSLDVARRLGVRHIVPEGKLATRLRRLLARALTGMRRLDAAGARVLLDPAGLAALRVLLRGFSATVISGSDALLSFGTETALLTLARGVCSHTPAAIAALGMVCVCEQRMDEAYRLGQLALRLQDRIGLSFTRAMTQTLVFFFINPWKLHLREMRPAMSKAMESGIALGEYEHAALAGHFLVNFTNFSGIDLHEADEEAARVTAVIDKLHQTRSVIGVRRHHQFSLNLIRPLDAGIPWLFTGPAFDEAVMLPILEAAEDKSALAMVYVYKMILAYLVDERERALEYSTWAAALVTATPAQPSVHNVAFYHALILLDEKAANDPNGVTDADRMIGTYLRQLRAWSRSCPVNFRHRFELVQAECFAARGDPRAEKAYLQAVRSAEASQYTQDAALAHRRTALLYAARGDRVRCEAHMKSAHRLYASWGALAIVQHLEGRYPWLRDVPATAPPASAPSSGMSFDVETLMTAGRLISSQIETGALVEEVIRIIMQSAGATRGILEIEEEGALVASLEARAADHGIEVLRNDTRGAARLDSPIANYVRRARESRVSDEVAMSADGMAHAGPAPRSVLCAPLLHRGKLDGIIYLENSLAGGVFTAERLKIVELLAAQAAVSLENAALYRLQETVAGQRERLQKAETLASLGALTAGVVHEVNNPAHIIGMNAAALSSSLRSLAAAIEDGTGLEQARALTGRMGGELREVTAAVARIESIVGNLKAHVGGGVAAVRSAVSLNLVVSSVLQISDGFIRRSTNHVDVRLDAGLRPVLGDFGRLQQMVRNLVENACEALTSTEQALRIHTANSPDSCGVELRVMDEGRGISEKALPRVLEPLYTTRREEGGTGLGLSIVAAIAREHGGEITMESREARGTCVTVRLPAVRAP